jgi:SAM-dependent methyltransferase
MQILFQTSSDKHAFVLAEIGLGRFLDVDPNVIELCYKATLSRQLHSSTYLFEGVHLNCPRGLYHPDQGSSSQYLISFVLNESFQYPPSVLDMGTGTGALVLALAKSLGPGTYCGVDIDDLAVTTAGENAKANSIVARFERSDLFANIQGQVKYHTVLFNPPLVDMWDPDISESRLLCDPRGSLLERFVDELVNRLSPGGQCFMVVSNAGNLGALADERISIQRLGYRGSVGSIIWIALRVTVR